MSQSDAVTMSQSDGKLGNRFGRNTFSALDLCLHSVDGATRLSSSFTRVAVKTQDILHKNPDLFKKPTKRPKHKTTQGVPPQASTPIVVVLTVNVFTTVCMAD